MELLTRVSERTDTAKSRCGTTRLEIPPCLSSHAGLSSLVSQLWGVSPPQKIPQPRAALTPALLLACNVRYLLYAFIGLHAPRPDWICDLSAPIRRAPCRKNKGKPSSGEWRLRKNATPILTSNGDRPSSIKPKQRSLENGNADSSILEVNSVAKNISTEPLTHANHAVAQS